MAQNNRPEIYLNALRSKPLKEIKFASSIKSKAFDEQKGKCIKCQRELKRVFAKFIQDPITKKYSVLCHNCVIKVAEKRR